MCVFMCAKFENQIKNKQEEWKYRSSRHILIEIFNADVGVYI